MTPELLDVGQTQDDQPQAASSPGPEPFTSDMSLPMDVASDQCLVASIRAQYHVVSVIRMLLGFVASVLANANAIFVQVNRTVLQMFFHKFKLKGHFRALRRLAELCSCLASFGSNTILMCRYVLMQSGDVMDLLASDLFQGLRQSPPNNW